MCNKKKKKKMPVVGNVIHFDPADFYTARQCQSALKWCIEKDRTTKEATHSVEINGLMKIYRETMDDILKRVA